MPTQKQDIIFITRVCQKVLPVVHKGRSMSRQVSAVPDLCCNVTLKERKKDYAKKVTPVCVN